MELPNLPDWLKISSVHFLAIAVALGALLFAPASFQGALGVTGFVDHYRMWIGSGFLISASILVARLGDEAFTFARKRLEWRRNLKRWERRLHNLTPAERKVLAKYIQGDTRTAYFSPEDGVVQGLELEKVLFRSANLGNMVMGFAYNIQPWAWDYLKRTPHLLDDEDESVDRGDH